MDVIEVTALATESKQVSLTPEEVKRLTDFFSVLIKIDKRHESKEIYADPRTK